MTLRLERCPTCGQLLQNGSGCCCEAVRLTRASAWWSGRLVWPFALLAKLPKDVRRKVVAALSRDSQNDSHSAVEPENRSED